MTSLNSLNILKTKNSLIQIIKMLQKPGASEESGTTAEETGEGGEGEGKRKGEGEEEGEGKAKGKGEGEGKFLKSNRS